MGAADTPAQLIELGQTEAVGPVHDDGVGAGNVDAGLDDGGAHQQVEALVIKIGHYPFQFPFAHLAVGDANARLGKQFLQFTAHAFDAFHLIVQEVDLAAALDLALAGFANEFRVPFMDKGFDGQAARRWGGDDGEVADTSHRHIEGAGDGSGGQGQDVNFCA